MSPTLIAGTRVTEVNTARATGRAPRRLTRTRRRCPVRHTLAQPKPLAGEQSRDVPKGILLAQAKPMSIASSRLLVRALLAAGATGSLVTACGGRTDQSLGTWNPVSAGLGGTGGNVGDGGVGTPGAGGTVSTEGTGGNTGHQGVGGSGGASAGSAGAGAIGGVMGHTGGATTGDGGSVSAGHGGDHAGGSGGACTGMCFVDFPCAPDETMRCISDTEFVPLASFGCEHTCGACPCSGGSCEPQGSPQSCPPGSLCVKGSAPSMFDRCAPTGGGGTGGATAKAECAPHGLCVPGEWCGSTTTRCACGSDGTFACDQPIPWGMTLKVCDYGGPSCPPETDVTTQTTIQQRLGVPCTGPVMGPPTFAQVADGTGECCYSVTVSGCVGRPLVIASEMRVARIISGHEWV